MPTDTPIKAVEGDDRDSRDVEVDSTGAESPVLGEADHPMSTVIHGIAAHLEHTGLDSPVRPFSIKDEGGVRSHPMSTGSSFHGHDVAGPGEILVISGGSGYNDLVGATPGATYVMPISDNGGSSSEIIRVLGGPSIGDLRSRLNRLIPISSRSPPSGSTFEDQSPRPPRARSSNDAIHNLLSYRLPTTGSSREIKQEWMDILEGNHPLWRGIEPERKEVIRGFLVHFESEVLRRAHRNFNFRGGSIGNFFLAAAQKFFRSIQSAIFLFSVTTQINNANSNYGGADNQPSGAFATGKVIPVINTNHTATIAAELRDGEIIVGQCEISHPAPKPTSRTSRLKAPAKSSNVGSGLTSQPPGTPASAVFDTTHSDAQSLSIASHQQQHQDPGLLTPGFGPPGHYPGQGFGTSYESMNSSVAALGYSHQSPSSFGSGAASPAPGTAPFPSSHPSHQHHKMAVGPSPLFARFVEERASAYAAASSRTQGLTRVGNRKDGLDPDDEDNENDLEDVADGMDGADHVSPLPDIPRDANTESNKIAEERTGNIVFSRTGEEGSEEESKLSSSISRIFYVNAYRNEIYPAPNPSFVTSIQRSRTLIYSCGSLWTSIIPCLCLRGIATTIAKSPQLQYKILLLNSIQDRETTGMDASDFVSAICDSLNKNDQPGFSAYLHGTEYKPHQLISHIVYFPDGQVKVQVDKLVAMGIKCIKATSELRSKSGYPKFDEQAVRQALQTITAE